MSETKCTPGPWELRDVEGAGLQVWAPVGIGGEEHGKALQPVYDVSIRPQLQVDDNGRATAQICYEDWRQFPSVNFIEMQHANARLIVAAPDLLNGCNALLGLLQLVCGRDDMPEAVLDALTTSHRIDEARAAIAKAEGARP